ncbi:N-6 DNA methylase [Nostoc sp. NZL]|uniref:N-6 DNA methylase n=1 Tax=Nostoc sp. NZL TaxID=2650612 RepID=UPI0018C739D1|nr:N-6 DNA methylase [Nostoc sp. NZL]MBG1243211.1 N-6 DNA methylase [Nostoc sp. NZL]
MNLADILKDSNYKLSQFTAAEIEQLEQSITLKATKSGEVPYIVCLVRQKAIKLTPEEAIRQLYLQVLNKRLHYPLSRIQVEYGVNFGREVKRADIVVMDKDRPNTVYMLVELKKPKLKDGKDQLRSYCNATGAPIAIWTNGDQISYYQRKDPNYFEDIPGLPNANQTLADILQIKFTLEDLIANDKLIKENKSLKTLIEEMEDEVLANAGVDVFEELFKLIFTKLYDEWYSGQGNRRKTRSLEFRNTGQTEAALKTKIQDLFDGAKKKWEGVFSEDAKISLTPSHLSVCVSSLENVKLFNSNLDVIDEAFEYLINQSSKGDKGQYFTPRYVIDMCVKMLNPQEDEYMIDTAAGSSGFPVHTIFHVWRQILADEGLQASHLFSLEDKPPRCSEYVEEKVFAIDFDEKAVRVARTLNLIAGDGQTNVLHLNTLDYELWNEVTEQEEWDNIYNAGFKRLKRLRPKGNKDFREFQFDVLMANPPFAGDIKEPRMIARYDLAKKPDGKWQSKVGRDILFIERNLDFLKPGGRMAIVLPQGRFNNSSDKNIRDFIAERCRILAVVGLHGNTFKPHTGTKTSVLFVQKWNDDPKVGALCPRQDDYNIFFATMRKSGKDNSGDKIWRKLSSSTSPPDDELSELMPPSPMQRVVGVEGDFLQDVHGHLVVDHDLYNHEGLTEDGIAEAFIEFAKKEKLSFFESSPSVTPFDAVRYQRLMDGLEAVEVLFGETLENKDFRIDSEFHRRPPIQNPNYSYVDVAETLTFVQYGISIDMNEEGEGTKIYRMNEIHNMLCDTEVSKFADISSVDIEAFKLKDRDILFNRTNSFEFVGRTGIFRNFSDEDLVFASYLIRVRTDESKILPEYLVAFLNSSLGIWDIKRRARISINQSNVNAQELAAIKIPLLNLEFQSRLNKLFEQAHYDRLKAIEIYQQAEDLLLSELGLKDWQPTEETISIKSFTESFLSSGRFDAEYYQPKFDQLIERLEEKVKLTPLGNLLTLNQRGKQPQYIEDENEYELGLPVVNSRHVREGEVILTDDNRYAYLPKNDNPLTIQTDDVLINGTGIGTIGRCAPYLYEQEALPDNHVTILRTDLLDPVYLSIYLNSVIGKLFVEKHFKGSSGQIELYPNEIAQFLIWDAPNSFQQKIRSKVEVSHQKREQSKQLLEIAKTGVERAIETDEAAATTWINQQLEALGINLSNLN